MYWYCCLALGAADVVLAFRQALKNKGLEDKVDISPSKLHAVAYGPYRPVADNETEEGRTLNRRIEIVLTPELEREQPIFE